jgi:hypothetical protein
MECVMYGLVYGHITKLDKYSRIKIYKVQGHA